MGLIPDEVKVESGLFVKNPNYTLNPDEKQVTKMTQSY